MRRYCIKASYQHREEVPHFDDTPFKDEFQRLVYEYAHTKTYEQIKSVVDVGCGSGYKLLHFFGHLQTVGVDVPRTVAWLRANKESRTWVEVGNAIPDMEGPTLVICSDVIEHVVEPDQFLEYLYALKGDVYVLSTPDRDLVDAGISDGPPRNIHHVREWNHDELIEYVSGRFEVVDSVRRATTIVNMRRKHVDISSRYWPRI